MSASGVNQHGKRSREPESGSDSSSTDCSDTNSRPSIPTPLPITTQHISQSSKIIHLDSESGERIPLASQMLCSLAGHRHTLSFASYEEYEVHYNKTHVNRCLECHKNFPTEHFLNLHIEETHDALVSVKRERGDKTVSPSCQVHLS